MLNEFLELQRYFKSVEIMTEQDRAFGDVTYLTSYGPDGIIRFNPEVFADRETAMKWNDVGPDTGEAPKNTTCFGTDSVFCQKR